MRRVVIALLLLAASAAFAADTLTGEARGNVLDIESKVALTGASMILINVDRGWQKQGESDANGNYVFVQLEPGNYTVKASKTGYYDAQHTDILIRLNQPKVVVPAFELRRLVGTPTQQTVVVQGEKSKVAIIDLSSPGPNPSILAFISEPGTTALVSLQDSALRWNFESTIVQNLPLRGGRSFDQLALFAPGVARVPFSSGEGPAVGVGVGSTGQFAVNGSRSRSNNFTVDGSDNNDEDIGVRRQGFVALVPQSVESVQDFQIVTAGAPAEFGRNSGAMVNAVSRSGLKTTHGTLYGFLNNDVLNARNFFDQPFPGYAGKDSNHSQYGGTIGGPIVEQRAYYFFSAEQQRDRGTALRHFVVPAISERGLRINKGFVPIDELGTFFAGRLLSYSDAAGKGVLDLYPLPNNPYGPFGANTYSQAKSYDADGTNFSLKADWYVSPTHSLAARYDVTNDASLLPFTSDAINSSIGTATRTQNLSLFANSTTPQLANALRISYGRTRLAFPPGKGSPLLFGSDPTGVPASLIRTVQTRYGTFGPFGATGPVGQLSILPYSTIGVDVYNFPQGRVDNTFQFSDFVTRTGFAHTIKTGFDLRRSQLNSFADRNSRPLLVFGYGQVSDACQENPSCAFATNDGKLRGTDLATLGAPGAVLQALSTDPAADTTIGLRQTQIEFFIQDDWRVHPSLMVNIGVRYELQTVPNEVNQRIEKTFGIQPGQFGHLAPTGSASNQSIILSGNTAFDAAVTALQGFLGGRTKIYQEDWNNIGPRIGFAWDPTRSGKTAIRGGFGVQFDANPGAFTSQSRNVFPTFAPMNFDPNFKEPTGQVINSPSYFTFQPTQTLLVKPGTLNTYNLGSDEFATGLGTLFAQSPPTPLGNLSSNGLAFTLPEFHLETAYAEHVVFTVEHQIAENWLLSASYVGTRGRHLPRFATPNGGLVSTPVLFAPTPAAPQLNIFDKPPYGNRPVPSLGAYTTLESSASSSYHAMQLSVEKRLSHTFQFRSNWTWSHAIDDVSDLFDGRGFSALPQDSLHPELDRASANFDVRHRVTGFALWSPFRNWDVAATGEFQTGQPYTINTAVDSNLDGNLTDRPGVGRNSARAQGIGTVDAALTRRFNIGEGKAVQIGAESFNIFNRTQFGIPVRIVESPGFGKPFDTQVDPRSIRFHLKVIF